MKQNRLIHPIIGLLLMFTLTGCILLPQEDEHLQPPLRAPDRIEYTTVEVTRGIISDELRGQGIVEARSGMSVSFGTVSGRLKALHFHSGEDVEEGDLLAELHNEELLEALERQKIYTRLAEIDFERYNRVSRLDREAAQLILSLSKLDLEKAQKALERSHIYAPISGRIVYTTNRKLDEHIDSFLSIYTIADLTHLNLRVSSEFASRIPLGAKVSFIINRETHYGTVVQTAALNPTDVTDRGITVIESETLNMENVRLGTSFTIVYERARAEDVIVIQNSLIRHDGGRSYVILLENDIPVERNIAIGIVANPFSEITSGLVEGELIIQ